MASVATSSIELMPTGLPSQVTADETQSHEIQQPHEDNIGREIGALASADGGLQAWLFLGGCVIVEMLVWGFVFAFGVFESYYSTTLFPGQQVASIGTTAAGILYLSTPLVFAALFRWPNARRATLWVGLFIMCAGLIGASFATSPAGLVATQGVVYAVGASGCYDPTFLFMDEWFVRRKGMAFGIMWAGTGLGGVIMPLIFQAALTRYGYAVVLRGYAVFLLVFLAPVLPFIRPRLPPTPVRKLDLTFLVSPSFLLMQAANVLEALGYFLPSIYLPSFAASLGASATLSTLTVVLVNVAAVFGCIGMGFFVDKYHVTTCQAVSTIGSVLGIFLLWGLSSSLGPLYAFCVVYGLFAGSYSTTWTGVATMVSNKVARAQPMLVFAFVVPGRGIGNIISGPLSAALLSGADWAVKASYGYGTQYGPLIVFTGVSMVLSGVPLLGRARKGLLTVA